MTAKELAEQIVDKITPTIGYEGTLTPEISRIFQDMELVMASERTKNIDTVTMMLEEWKP